MSWLKSLKTLKNYLPAIHSFFIKLWHGFGLWVLLRWQFLWAIPLVVWNPFFNPHDAYVYKKYRLDPLLWMGISKSQLCTPLEKSGSFKSETIFSFQRLKTNLPSQLQWKGIKNLNQILKSFPKDRTKISCMDLFLISPTGCGSFRSKPGRNTNLV